LTVTSFLIVHKVDGKPAFDIADRLDHGTLSDPAPWWILIDGHRAYPYFTVPLSSLYLEGGLWLLDALPEMPAGVRDFFILTGAKKVSGKINELDLGELGL
jgi:hypothetical protein